MTDLFNMLATYLHDVFVIKFDGWVILGFAAQGFFTMRFVVQWIASERARKSVIPVAFWFFSIGGGVLLLVYALYRRDPVFIAGQALASSSRSQGEKIMNFKQVLHYFTLAVTGLAAAGLLTLVSAPTYAQQAAVAIDNDDIGGVVLGPTGPEAGVWVIAETTELPTKFARRPAS